MTATFWIKRFLLVYAIALVVIFAAGMLRSRGLEPAFTHAAIWAAPTAAVFVAVRFNASRGNRNCVLCGDAPSTSAADAPSPKV